MTTLHCAKGLLATCWESHLQTDFHTMQQRPGGILLLIPKDFTACRCNGRQHPQLWGSLVSAGPKHGYSLKIYLSNCSQLACSTSCHEGSPNNPLDLKQNETKPKNKPHTNNKIPPKSVFIVSAKEFKQ